MIRLKSMIGGKKNNEVLQEKRDGDVFVWVKTCTVYVCMLVCSGVVLQVFDHNDPMYVLMWKLSHVTAGPAGVL